MHACFIMGFFSFSLCMDITDLIFLLICNIIEEDFGDKEYGHGLGPGSHWLGGE